MVRSSCIVVCLLFCFISCMGFLNNHTPRKRLLQPSTNNRQKISLNELSEPVRSGEEYENSEMVFAVQNMEELQEKLDKSGQYDAVVVKVYSESCRACKFMTAQFVKVLEENPNILGLKINGGMYPELSKKLGVRGVPTFIMYINGERVDHFYAKTRDALEENIEVNM
uniref:Thioredoxin domain-containing protein n=1 Tax=Fibrocapsa japonica TaxID=94617 RepID=A0A7S2V7D3_9STRA|mmetsp:Transcript_625/g.903  ORF Transcript_625/g.903 Transcript_625/m.903 type:complete len:168 (+) Transcript_625:83-586(+)